MQIKVLPSVQSTCICREQSGAQREGDIDRGGLGREHPDLGILGGLEEDGPMESC